MKKLSILVSGAALVCLLIATAWANGGNISPQSDQPAVEPEVIVESGVSQSQIDTEIKRENARAQRDMKLRIRARNVQVAPLNNDELFRTSK